MTVESTPSLPGWATRLHGSQLAPTPDPELDPVAELVLSSHYLLLEEIMKIQQHLGMLTPAEDRMVPHG